MRSFGVGGGWCLGAGVGDLRKVCWRGWVDEVGVAGFSFFDGFLFCRIFGLELLVETLWGSIGAHAHLNFWRGVNSNHVVYLTGRSNL